MNRSVLIVAGGTGGHVYPGLAVAHVLAANDAELHWMGTARGIEARVVPQNGLCLWTIPMSGLRRRGWWRWLIMPLQLGYAVACALIAMIRIRPRVVLGMGGFVSAPGGLAAWLCRRPLIIHEQNAIAGLSNRLLSRFASRVLQAFPATFASHCSAVTTGNPVRAAIAALAPPRARAISAAPPRVLVFGGSQGARALNMIVPQALATAGVAELRVLHQCGTHEVESTRARYAELGLGERVEVVRFIDDMAAAYSAADLVVARAGASTIAEITACGVAAIVVPYPHAVDDHQSANARQLERAHAAVVIAERDLDVARLSAEFARLLGDRDARLALAERARELGHPQASVKVAQFCLDYLDA